MYLLSKLHENKVKQLANLGILWGIVKYYHPIAARGQCDMDNELRKVLPLIYDAENFETSAHIMEKWFDSISNIDSSINFFETPVIPNCLGPHIFFDANGLTTSLINKVRAIMSCKSDITGHHYYEFLKTGNVRFTNEISDEKNSCPDATTRLIALFRYWNAIEYFYPYKHLMACEWKVVLNEFILHFISANNIYLYLMTFYKIISKIDDGHACIEGENPHLAKLKGNFMSPFQARIIEDKLIVTNYYNGASDICRNQVRIGDQIEKIDSVLVSEWISKYLPYTFGANNEYKLTILPSIFGFLLRSNMQKLEIGLVRHGDSLNVKLDRIPINKSMFLLDVNYSQSNVSHKLISNSIGYLYPALLKEGEFESVKKNLQETSGLIIDFRCYPSMYVPYVLGDWLKSNTSEFAKIKSCANGPIGIFQDFNICKNGDSKNDHYKGKVIVIVNSHTISAAEFAVMAISSARNVIVIGSKTAGSDGNTSALELPGNVFTWFSGCGVCYPDNSETQKKGVNIDHVITPTVAGIMRGSDELLEKAIDLLRNSN